MKLIKHRIYPALGEADSGGLGASPQKTIEFAAAVDVVVLTVN
jgi:hypothetical protein